MKKPILIFLAMCLLMTGLFCTGAMADYSTVSYEGEAEKFVFLPSDDLFVEFKNVLPGDVLTQTIYVENNSKNYARIYLRAEPSEQADKDFLDQLHMTVTCRNQEIFDAAPSESAQLTKNTLLGSFKSEGGTVLTVTLTVPIDLGNEYMGSTVVGVVPWVFTVEDFPEDELSGDTPHTGDWFRPGVWMSAAALLAFVILVLLFVQKKRRAEEE